MACIPNNTLPYSLQYVMHYFLPGHIGLGSKVMHHIGDMVAFGDTTPASVNMFGVELLTSKTHRSGFPDPDYA